MVFWLDRMNMDDVPEVMAIERDSFLTPWPFSAYKRELGSDNQSAHYLVLRLNPKPALSPASLVRPAPVGRRGFWSNIFPLQRLRDLTPVISNERNLGGYAGLWLIVDEAHITTIAVRPEFRGRGLGELMLVALTDIAIRIRARWLTLEVRVSNTVAQTLYRKYGFKPAGIRQRYYTDNHEDAMIMWTDEITTTEFLDRFHTHRRALMSRLMREGGLEEAALGFPVRVT